MYIDISVSLYSIIDTRKVSIKQKGHHRRVGAARPTDSLSVTESKLTTVSLTD